MSEVIKDNHTFIGYEYKEVITTTEKMSFLIDSYRNFGWVVDENVVPDIKGNVPQIRGTVVLRLKRDRKIINRMELTRLQRNFEFCIKEMEQLENSKTSQATMYSIIVGVIGTAFMAGSVFAVTATPPMIFLCIVLAIPAFAGWIIPYFLYRYTYQRRSEKVTPLIEDKQEEIYELCEKGSKLLI